MFIPCSALSPASWFAARFLCLAEGPVLVDNVEVRTKRSRSKSTKAVYFSSLTLITHASSASPRCSSPARRRRPPLGGRVAAESCRVKRIGVHESSTFKVDEGPVLVEKVEVRTKRPRSKSTKAGCFSSLTLPLAGRKRPRW